MYERKEKSYAFIALAYWLMFVLVMLVVGIIYKSGTSHFKLYYYAITLLIYAFALLIVYKKDHSFKHIGMLPQNKTNLIIALLIVLATFVAGMICQKYTIVELLKQTIYYLFYIGLCEELVFRGLIQSYLFGLKANKYFIFILGAFLFSISHLPFQMYIHSDVSIHYVMQAMPQLIYTFITHLVMCVLAYWRKDLMIPTALHYANNFLDMLF